MAKILSELKHSQNAPVKQKKEEQLQFFEIFDIFAKPLKIALCADFYGFF